MVRLHVEVPSLGAGQLQTLAFRVLGFQASRETIRRILMRNHDLIVESSRERRARRIVVDRPNRLWGIDLTHFWVLGVIPVWVFGAIDYHGSRLVSLEPLAWPTAGQVEAALRRAFVRHGVPARILTDRGPLFRSEVFRRLLGGLGVSHTRTLPGHPWTNGRIERLFRTLKETLKGTFWLIRSRGQLVRSCRDFTVFYNTHRPHSAYGGRTPDEVHAGRPARAGHSGRISLMEGRLRWWRLS